ncbi:MAG: FxsA family protein [Thermaerobacter sp.]|nr:FxsA family protein [Thermaerobacter sp.]
MFRRLFAIFLVVPAIELLALFGLAHFLGWGWTLVITVGSSLLGAYLAQVSGRRWWTTVRTEWAAEGFPVHRLGEGALLVVSGAFLITPGPLTGFIGLLFLLPAVRAVAARWILRWASNRVIERFWR